MSGFYLFLICFDHNILKEPNDFSKNTNAYGVLSDKNGF